MNFNKQLMILLSIIKTILKSSLFRTAGFYGGFTIINAIIPFLLLPILTRAMTPTDFGLVAIFSVLMTFFSPFIGLSTHAAIARQYYNKEDVDFRIYLTNCFFILLSSTLFFSIFIFLFADQISVLSAFPKSWIGYVIITSFCTTIVSIALTLWQVQSKSFYYGIFQVSNTIVNVIFSLWFVIFLGLTWKGRILAQVVTSIIFAIFSLFILRRNKWFKFIFNKKYILNALKFSIPLIPHTLGAIVMSMTDRIFIAKFVGLNAAGLFSVGYTFASIIGFMENSFNLAYAPWLFSKLKTADFSYKKRLVKFTYFYFIIILLLSILFSLSSPYFLKYYLGKEFQGAREFVFWLCLSFSFSGMYKMVVNYIFYAEKTNLLAWITFTSAAINIPANYFLINHYGAVGSAMATAFVSIFFFFFTWILSNRVYKMPWLFQKQF